MTDESSQTGFSGSAKQPLSRNSPEPPRSRERTHPRNDSRLASSNRQRTPSGTSGFGEVTITVNSSLKRVRAQERGRQANPQTPSGAVLQETQVQGEDSLSNSFMSSYARNRSNESHRRGQVYVDALLLKDITPPRAVSPPGKQAGAFDYGPNSTSQKKIDQYARMQSSPAPAASGVQASTGTVTQLGAEIRPSSRSDRSGVFSRLDSNGINTVKTTK